MGGEPPGDRAHPSGRKGVASSPGVPLSILVAGILPASYPNCSGVKHVLTIRPSSAGSLCETMALEDHDLEQTTLPLRPAIDGSDIRKLGADDVPRSHVPLPAPSTTTP